MSNFTSSGGFSDPMFHTENEVQLPLPTIQPDYSFLPDDGVQQTVPPIDSAFVDANPNVIHYDIFGGMHLNLVDPFKYIWPTKLLGQPMLDAEDLALFPPEIVEELIKDSQHKTIIPAMDDITDARRRLLNMANFFDPLGDLDEEARMEKERLESETKTLQIVKPHMFQDDYAKAKTMESAQNNAMNYYYQPVYTEDTIQTWVSKRKYKQYADKQTDLEAYKTMGERRATQLLTTVDKTPEAIKAYIDASFDAMNQAPIHPTLGAQVTATSISPFFSRPLDQLIPRQHPEHLPRLSPELQIKADQLALQDNGPNNNTLVWITATSEAKLTSQNVITHELSYNEDGSTGFEGFAIFRPAQPTDVEFLEDTKDVDQETMTLLTEAKTMADADPFTQAMTQKTVKVWESVAQPVPIQQLFYEDSFIASYDDYGNIIANNVGSRLSLKPYQLASKTPVQIEAASTAITNLPHIVTLNHPGFYDKSFEPPTQQKVITKVKKTLVKEEMGGDGRINPNDYAYEGRRYGDDESEEEEEEDGEDLYPVKKDKGNNKNKREKREKSSKRDKKDKKSSKKDKKSSKDRDIEAPDLIKVEVMEASMGNSMNDGEGGVMIMDEQIPKEEPQQQQGEGEEQPEQQQQPLQPLQPQYQPYEQQIQIDEPQQQQQQQQDENAMND